MQNRVEAKTIPVRKRVYEHLKAAILSGRLSPEERLTEEHLAEMLGGKEQAVMVRREDSSLSILTKSDLIFTLFKAEKASQSL